MLFSLILLIMQKSTTEELLSIVYYVFTNKGKDKKKHENPYESGGQFGNRLGVNEFAAAKGIGYLIPKPGFGLVERLLDALTNMRFLLQIAIKE